MPYTHYHNWSIHRHHRRPRGGNHWRAVDRRQRPWRVAFVFVLILVLAWLVVALATERKIWPGVEWARTIISTDEAREQRVLYLSPTAVPPTDQSEGQEAKQQTQEAETKAKTATRTAQATTGQTRTARAATQAVASVPKLERHERAVVSGINRERNQRGIGTLEWDARLQTIARAHSRDMAEQNYFSHTNKDGLGYRARALEAGYRCPNPKWQGVAENLFFGPRGYKSSQAPVTSWLGSPLHKRAMLDASFNRAAIGVHEGYLSGYGKGYFTTLLLC